MAKPQNTNEYLIVTLPWIIIILGFVGNAFCAVIMLRKQFRNKNIGVYLLALAILDTIFLLSNTLFHWGIRILFEVDVQALSHSGCVIVKYVIYASRAMSAWILVVLSLERMLALAIPHLAMSINTKKRAIITTLVVVIVQAIIYTSTFKMHDIKHDKCRWSDEVMYKRHYAIVIIFDFINYSLIPSVIMATSNSVLIYLLKNSQEMCNSHGGFDMRSITILVVTTSMAFIVLTMPLSIQLILVVVGVKTGPSYIIYTTVYALDLLNHAINFLLYCISGASFRNEVKVMFGNCCSFLKHTSRGTNITSVNPTSSSEPGKAGTSRMGSYSNQQGDVEDQNMEMM